MRAVELTVRIERKQAGLPAFVVVPASAIAKWELAGTTTIEGSLDEVPLGRRSLKRWDDERWFVELKREHLESTGRSVGDLARLSIHPASTELPDELQRVLDAEPAARARWLARTEAQRRMLREDIAAAKTAATREKRARKALLPDPPAKTQPASRLDAAPRSIRVRILARDLPGRSCGPYSDVAVGFVSTAGQHPETMVPADAPAAEWETTIEVRDKSGVAAFRGPAVHGPAHERFFYLAWIGREGRAAPAMFRRAKLRLDAIPPDVLSDGARTGRLVARLGLTAEDGMPLCASVKPPVIAWSSVG